MKQVDVGQINTVPSEDHEADIRASTLRQREQRDSGFSQTAFLKMIDSLTKKK